MMKWWRRLIFFFIILVLGYISLDYLYSAFTKLTNASGSAAAYSPKGDGKTGEQKVKKKWFDIILQIVIIITGMIIRWAYLMFIYLPKL